MLHPTQYYRDLVTRFFKNEMSAGEVEELFAFINEEPDTYRKLVDDMEMQFTVERLADQCPVTLSVTADGRVREKLRAHVMKHAGPIRGDDLHPGARIHRVHFLHTAWFRVAVAVLIFAGIGAYLWLQPSTDKPAITQTKPVPEKNDVLPGGNKAILKLADGSEILLDSAANGRLAQQAGANIEKTDDGQIVYSLNKNSLSQTLSYNTMSTPRGGQYQLALPDGSKVWLNAASSITFPTSFVEKTREVSVTGEAYFEVARNPKQAFVVKTPKEDVTVLGTRFNVNAYADEPAMKTSLIEGAVRVGNSLLKPGQAYSNGEVVTTNLEQDIAWKNGAFNFHDMDLMTAFRLLARWYNVEVKYVGAIPRKKIRGEIGRDLTLSEVLKTLSELGINTKIDGTSLEVLPD